MSRRVGATLLALVLLAGACGSDDSAPTTGDETTLASAPVPTTTAPVGSTTQSTEGSTTPLVEGPGVVVVSDLPYYESETGGVMYLDVYHPPSAEGLPLVVLFHTNPIFGGGKEGMEGLATIVAQRGAVAVVPSYGGRLFSPGEVVRWFREQGPCAVWTAVDMAPSYGADSSELILFGETTGSFPASTSTFSSPAEISGCAAPPTDTPVVKAIFFEQDWFFVPELWDSVLADDPGFFATIQPWDDLTNPTQTSIQVVVGEQ
ncbi:MAG: hypothetical protein KJO36_05460, partial [Acidimicrobiia bacterium]|nr:hypothetical protein [Acidimicrobiia bacterium]